MGKLGSPVARDPASLHFLPDCSEAVDPVTKSAVINEWLRSYQQENNAFASVSVKTQAKLRRAAVFGERMASPNKLQTAVAFEVLEELTALFGRYKDVASEALSVLRSAVYVDASATDGPVFMNNGQLESSSVAPRDAVIVSTPLLHDLGAPYFQDNSCKKVPSRILYPILHCPTTSCPW